MNDITYVPIFDQTTPGIWDDFLRIRSGAMESNYNLSLSDSDIKRYKAEYKQEFFRHSYSFAFGAYDGDQMVGFIRGNAGRSCACIKCLYVLPTHQGRHIGNKLLSLAERSVAPVCKNIELTSLGHAEEFYKKNKYASSYGTNVYSKHLNPINYYDTAIFGCVGAVDKSLRVFDSSLQFSSLIGKTTPVFVRFGNDNNIDGILVGDTAGDIALLKTKLNSPNDWARRSLSLAFKNYKSHSCISDSQKTR